MARRSWWVLTVLLAAPLLAGCLGSDEPTATPTTPPTPLAKLDVATVQVVTAEFCDRVSDAAVRAALDGDPTSDESWGNGEAVGTDQGSGDIGSELGCAWTGAGGAAARAWLFARPVTRAFAAGMVRHAGKATGCTADAAPLFGDPALVESCRRPGGLERVRRAGLFGDSWVTCEVSTPRSVPEGERLGRLDDWCANVLSAVRNG